MRIYWVEVIDLNELIEKDYLNDLNKIKETIKQNRNKAMVVVNSAMIMTYYEIGTIINKRKTWVVNTYKKYQMI